MLSVEPAMITLTVTDRATAASEQLEAFLSDQADAVDATWTAEGNLVGVAEDGTVSSLGMVSGETTITARFGDLQATAVVQVRVELSEVVGEGPQSPENQAALDGDAQPDPGEALPAPNPTQILYPYEGTVMPRGLTAPVLQFSPGNLPPQDAKVSLTSNTFRWEGSANIGTPSQPQFAIPQDIWDAALLSSGDGVLEIEVTKAVDGVAYGPARTAVVVAPGTLTGAVYYMTYQADALGLWSVRPGVQQPATRIVEGCVVCHSASSNGTRLSTGADAASLLPQSGVYEVGTDGSAVQLTGAPAGLGGDTRGLSFATFTPDGRYVMRSTNDFWGGINQRAWRVDEAAGQLVEATVNGLGAEVSAYLPSMSHDGSRYVFTNGVGTEAALGTASRSLSVMDLTVDEASDVLNFANRRLLIDNGPGGDVVKFAAFMPDASQVIFQEGKDYHPGFGEMLPTWGTGGPGAASGHLSMVRGDEGEYVRLDRLNAGLDPADLEHNYEPFTLPVAAGGYFWVVFTSKRQYGNTQVGAGIRKQLWVAAISPDAAPGEDPSHPPFYLPNQSDTANERGFWALEPCRADGETCATGNECCGGFCRPADPNDPASGSVCAPPEEAMCSQLDEACESDGDCCDVTSGAECIGNFCVIPAPPIPI